MQSPVDFADIVHPKFVRHHYKLVTDTYLRVFRCHDVALSVASRYRTDLDDTSDPLRSPPFVSFVSESREDLKTPFLRGAVRVHFLTPSYTIRLL